YCRTGVTVPPAGTGTVASEGAGKPPSFLTQWLQRVKAETGGDCRRAGGPHSGADFLLSAGEIMPVVSWGFFNPLAPTACTLALGRQSLGEEYLLFDAVSNPFIGFCTTVRGWHSARLDSAILEATLLNVAKTKAQDRQQTALLCSPPTFIVMQRSFALPPSA